MIKNFSPFVLKSFVYPWYFLQYPYLSWNEKNNLFKKYVLNWKKKIQFQFSKKPKQCLKKITKYFALRKIDQEPQPWMSHTHYGISPLSICIFSGIVTCLIRKSRKLKIEVQNVNDFLPVIDSLHQTLGWKVYQLL